MLTPQMAPLSWLTLCIYFIITLILINSLNYFLYINQANITISKHLLKNNNSNWKW